jgi:hypothetical protein
MNRTHEKAVRRMLNIVGQMEKVDPDDPESDVIPVPIPEHIVSAVELTRQSCFHYSDLAILVAGAEAAAGRYQRRKGRPPKAEAAPAKTG